MNKINIIENYLDELYPNPRCELEYNKDYELLIAIMLSAQTTDKRVNKVTKVLFSKYTSLEELNNANIEDIKLIIKEIGTFNKKAKFIKDILSILVNNFNSKVPYNREELEKMPGIGRKTINVFFGEMGIEANIAVDTHVERVSKRLSLAAKNDSVIVVENKLKKKLKKENWVKRHKQMVLFGRYNCKAIKPECDSCKLREFCKYSRR